jgi:hypothetical protein
MGFGQDHGPRFGGGSHTWHQCDPDEQQAAEAYGTAEMPLSFTSDVTGVVLQVPDEKQAKSGDNP